MPISKLEIYSLLHSAFMNFHAIDQSSSAYRSSCCIGFSFFLEISHCLSSLFGFTYSWTEQYAMPVDGWVLCLCKITRNKCGQRRVGRYSRIQFLTSDVDLDFRMCKCLYFDINKIRRYLFRIKISWQLMLVHHSRIQKLACKIFSVNWKILPGFYFISFPFS